MDGGLPLVCIPGTLCDGRVFEPLLANLPDRPLVRAGFGDARDMEAAAREVLATAPRKFIAIGFSLGGFVALQMLRSAPTRVVALALISSHAHPDREAAAHRRLAQVELARQRGPAAVIEELWPSYVAAANRRRDDLKDLVADMAEATGTDRFAAQAELNIARPDQRRWLSEVNAAVLVACGEEDALCPRAWYEGAAASPNGQLVVTAGAGHFLPLEQPERLAEAIGPWLAAIGASKSPLPC